MNHFTSTKYLIIFLILSLILGCTPFHMNNKATSLKDCSHLQDETELIDCHVQNIHSKLSSNWSAPVNSYGLETTISIQTDLEGYIIEKTIVSSSGNYDFDGLALRAVDKSEPLPVPHNKLLYIKEFGEILFHFSTIKPNN